MRTITRVYGSIYYLPLAPKTKISGEYAPGSHSRMVFQKIQLLKEK